MIFWLVLKLEISYNIVIISWRFFLVSFRGFVFWRLYFCMVKYLSFHHSSLCLKILFNVNDKATMWHTPCWFCNECCLEYLGRPMLLVWKCRSTYICGPTKKMVFQWLLHPVRFQLSSCKSCMGEIPT